MSELNVLVLGGNGLVGSAVCRNLDVSPKVGKLIKSLARKMVQLYKLSSEQLSKQDHYDFGMRAVKSVLVMAGALRRKESKLAEDIVLIRAMRDSNVPKFLEHDLPLFMGIIADLFPKVEIPNIDYGSLQRAI